MGFREKIIIRCVLVSTFLLFLFVYQLLLLDVFSDLYQNTTLADFSYVSLKSHTAIWFIDFHRFPLSIDKNHLIASDFYRLTTPGNDNINIIK